MEEADKDPEEASEPSVLSENQEAESGVSTQEEDPRVEEEVEEPEKRIIKLQRDLLTLVTNIQTAADAKESTRRTELEEARRLRLEQLENDAKSSQEKCEEITRRWSTAMQKVIPQELQEALNNQQQLCATIIEDKKKLINDLQQELKARDHHFVKDLRKQEEELDVMMERMEDQIKILTKAYREELDQIERVYQQESEILLTRDKTEWKEHMKNLWDKELRRLTKRKKKVEEYEAIIHNLMLETINKYSLAQLERNAKFQVLNREHQQIKATGVIVRQKQIKLSADFKTSRFNLDQMKRRLASLQTERKNLMTEMNSQDKEFTKRSQRLTEDYKRHIQRYERTQKKMKHFAVADARRFKEMWLMLEAEVKQLVERALVLDSLICKQHLSLAWERPPMAFMELSGPVQPQTHARQAVSQLFQPGQCSQRTVDTSVGPRLETDTESTDMEMYKEGTAMQSESGAKVEEGKLSRETLEEVMELLCDEACFLLDDKLLNLLASLEKEEQTFLKHGSLLHSLGIEEEDVPKLALFLFKYTRQQREQTEDVCVESGQSSDKAEGVETSSTTHLTSDLIDPNHVLPALKSFLVQLLRSKESQRPSFQQVESRDTSKDKAYWESMGNIISEDKVKLWDAAEKRLNQYHTVLTEISELVPKTQSLEQQNAELRMLLQQQSLSSRV